MTETPGRNALGQFTTGNPGRPLTFKSPEELETAIEAYMQECRELGKPRTLAGLAVALGTDRKTLYNYEERDPYFHVIKRARAHVEAELEERLVDRSTFSPGQIFSLKNNFDWVDRQEVTHKTPVEVTVIRFGDTEAGRLETLDAETVEESNT